MAGIEMMNRKRLTLLIAIFLSANLKGDAPFTWVGSPSGDMNNPLSWQSNSTPSSGDELLFTYTSPSNFTVIQNVANPYSLSVGYPNTSTSPSITLVPPSSAMSYTFSDFPFIVQTGGGWINCGGGPTISANTFGCAISIPSGTNLALYGNNKDVFSGDITGDGGLLLGGGSLVLSGSNGYTGPTTLGSAGVSINTANAICPTSLCTIQSSIGVLTLNANQTLNIDQASIVANVVANSNTFTLINTQDGANWSGSIEYLATAPTSGTGSGGTLVLAAGSTGTLILSNDNSYSYVSATASFIGDTTVNAGTLQGSAPNSFGIQSNISVGASGTLTYPSSAYTSSANTLTGAGTVNLGSLTNSTLNVYSGGTFSGTLNGSAAIIYFGSNLWSLSNVTTSSNYNGVLTIAGGNKIALQGLPSGSALTIQTAPGGKLKALGAFTIAQTITLSTSGGIDTNGNNVLTTGKIEGGGALIKTGTGTLTLQGTSGYTGGTQVSGGTLVFSTSASFPTSGNPPLIISNAGIVDMSTTALNDSTISYLSGTGSSASLLLGTNAVTILFGNGPSPAQTSYGGTISGSGSLTISNGELTTTSTDPFSSFTGSLTLGDVGSGTLVTNSLGGITALNFREGGTSGVNIGANTSFSGPVSINVSGVPTVGQFYINDLITMTVSGAVSSGDTTGTLQKDGPGTLILSGTNTGFSGITSVVDGTLQLGSSTALGSTAEVNLGASGVLNLNGYSLSIQQLTGLVEGASSSSVEVTSPGVLTITSGLSTNPFYGVITGNGAVVLEGTTETGQPEPQPTFFGANTYTGTTTLTNGVYFNTQYLGDSSTYLFTGTGGIVTVLADDDTPVNNFSVASGATGTLSTNTFNLTVGGTITVPDSTTTFAKIGQGTLTLTADNSATLVGDLVIEGGVLNVTHLSVGAPSSITFQQFCGTLQAAGSSISLNPTSGIVMATTGIIDTQTYNVAIPGNIIYLVTTGMAAPIGGGGLTKTGSGTLTLSGTNTYNGNTTLLNGTLIANQAAFPTDTTATATIVAKQLLFEVISGGTGVFEASGAFTSFPKVVFFSSGTIDTNGHNIVANNSIAGGSAYTFTKSGTAILTLSGTNTYSGPTLVTAGTLQAGVVSVFSGNTQTSGAFGVGSAITVSSGATLDLDGFSNTIGMLSGAGSVTTGSGVLTISNGNGNTFSGGITGAGGGLTLAAGTLTLSGDNSLSAATVDSGATLILDGGTNALGVITNSGTLIPYQQVTGTTYTQTGTLDVSNLATFPGTGVIDGSGIATLGGTLILPRIQPGSNQVILQYSSETGMFSTVTNLGNTTIEYNATQAIWNIGTSTACQGTWNVAGAGAWETSGNWSTSCAPGIGNTGGAEDDTAVFGYEMGQGAITVTLNSVATLGALSIGSATDYTISGTGSITMGGTAALSPQIQVYYGPHTIAVPITVADTLSIMSGTGADFLTISGNVNLNSTTLTLTNSFISPTGVITVSGNFLSPGGNIILNGGALELQGLSSEIANLTIQSGTLQIDTSSQPVQVTFSGSGAGIWQAEEAVTLSSALVLTAAGTIDTQTNAVSSTGIISGAGALTKIGSNTCILAAANTYTGATTVSVGTLQAGIISTSTTGAFGVGSAVTVSSGATLALNGFNNTVGSLSGAGAVTLGSGVLTISSGGGNTLSGQISGSGGGITLVSGVQTFSHANGYTGTTTVSGGTLQAGVATTAFGTGSPIVLSGSGILSLNGYNNTVGSLTSSSTSSKILLGANTLTIGVSTGQSFQGVISGTGGVTKNGSGAQILNGANTYTGATTVSVGTLQAGVVSVFSGSTQTSGAFGVGSAVTVSSGATLAIDTYNTTIGSLTGAGNVNLGSGSAVLTIANGDSLSFSGAITGSGGLTLTTGTLTLSGNSNYTGPTTVSGGTLQAGASTNVLGNGSAVTVASGAELTFQTYAVTEVGALTNNGTVVAANTINVASYTQAAGGALTLNISAPGFIDSSGPLVLNGTLNVTGSISSPLTLLSGTSLTGTFSSPPAGYTVQYSPKMVSPATVKLVSADCSGTWISSASDVWDNSSNWSGGCVPGISAPAGDTATFAAVASAEVAIELTNGSVEESPTLLNLVFNTAATSYTISQFSGGGGEFTLDGSIAGTTPTIQVEAGSHTINVPIVGSSSSVSGIISIASGATLTFGSAVSLGTLDTLTITDTGGLGTFNNAGVLEPDIAVIEGNNVNNSGWIITSSGDLTIQGTANIVNTGLLSSFAAFTVTGGTLTNNELILSDTVTMSGGTVVNNGDLSTNNIAMSGGQLTNNYLITTEPFTLSGGTLTNAALITTTVFTESNSPQYNVNIASTSSFGGITTETATLTGPLTVTALPGLTLASGETLDLIYATNSIVSQFSSISLQGFPGSIIPSIQYTANAVQLVLVPSVPSHASTSTTSLTFTSVGQHNTELMRKCLQLRGRLPTAAPNSLVAANEEMSPFRKRQEMLSQKVAVAKQPRPWTIYGGPIASFGQINPKQGQPGSKYSSIGALAGSDYAFEDNDSRAYYVGIGGAVDYRCKTGVIDENGGAFFVNKLHGTVYSTIVPKALPDIAIDFLGGYAYAWDDLHRNTGLNGSEVAIGTPHESIIDLLFDLEYTFSNKTYSSIPEGLALIPILDLQYIYDHISGYEESGAGMYDLQFASQDPQSLSTFLGTRVVFSGEKSLVQFHAEVDFGWQREYLDHNRIVDYEVLSASGTTASTTALGMGRNSWLLEFDFLTTICEVVQIEAMADFKWNSLFFDAFFYLGIGGEF